MVRIKGQVQPANLQRHSEVQFSLLKCTEQYSDATGTTIHRNSANDLNFQNIDSEYGREYVQSRTGVQTYGSWI